VLKTKTLDNEPDPEWYLRFVATTKLAPSFARGNDVPHPTSARNESVVIEVTPDDFDAGRELTVRVWDSDGPLLKGDFLGQAVLSTAELLRIQPPDAPTISSTTTSLGLTSDITKGALVSDGLAVLLELRAKEGAFRASFV
jgi:hypothetical protein